MISSLSDMLQETLFLLTRYIHYNVEMDSEEKPTTWQGLHLTRMEQEREL